MGCRLTATTKGSPASTTSCRQAGRQQAAAAGSAGSPWQRQGGVRVELAAAMAVMCRQQTSLQRPTDGYGGLWLAHLVGGGAQTG